MYLQHIKGAINQKEKNSLEKWANVNRQFTESYKLPVIIQRDAQSLTREMELKLKLATIFKLHNIRM